MNKDFCRHCGRELTGNESQCPECGAPLNGDVSQNYVPKQMVSKLPIPQIAIGVVAVVAVIAMLVFGISPLTATYNTTITVEEISIDDSFECLYSADGNYAAFLSVTIGGKTMALPENNLYLAVPTDGSVYKPTENNSLRFSNTGQDPTIEIYLCVYVPGITGTGEDKEGDYVDVYKVDTTQIEGDVSEFGVSGIRIDKSSLDSDGYIVLEGDSQPIGHVKLKVSIDKA